MTTIDWLYTSHLQLPTVKSDVKINKINAFVSSCHIDSELNMSMHL